MPERRLSTKAVTVKRIQATAVLTILFFLIGGAAVFSPLLSVTLAAVALLLYIYTIKSFLKSWYSSYYYDIFSDCIKIKKGVFISKNIVIFRSRIQYSDIIQTPLQRFFHTCTVIIHTAGAVVYLSEIDVENASAFNEI